MKERLFAPIWLTPRVASSEQTFGAPSKAYGWLRPRSLYSAQRLSLSSQVWPEVTCDGLLLSSANFGNPQRFPSTQSLTLVGLMCRNILDPRPATTGVTSFFGANSRGHSYDFFCPPVGVASRTLCLRKSCTDNVYHKASGTCSVWIYYTAFPVCLLRHTVLVRVACTDNPTPGSNRSSTWVNFTT